MIKNQYENLKVVHGFKVFKSDWKCRDKQYSCPGKFEEEGGLSVCGHGMHFCENVADCFSYYDFDSNNKVAEVIAYGTVLKKGDKSCTDKLEIVREIPWDEVLRLVNAGKNCTGRCNTGDWNTGDWNTGRYNTGDRNTGDWNKSSFNTGCFNTEEQKIMLFNKPSDWTYSDWLCCEARCILSNIPKNIVEWIYSKDMTDEEKAEHPTHEITGGYLKMLDESECAQVWWNDLTDYDKNVIKSIPNFDADIFEQCTGIRI